ncbi:MAG: NADP-binding 6-phosphogluconate dehydrogenase [Olpidium bornovanus]|uniref:3-hydroxyisobutyrate dehydrogenase n=1 Tax=Olpidium bornovanus TaxID=278681 RepID=A0A8H7ZTM0_9FUNG|nr:MAG: NADP-binding 6-phosphogluconate dehydrogenase [Olpidium bornovanus]
MIKSPFPAATDSVLAPFFVIRFRKEVTVGFIGLGQMGFPMATNLRHNSRCRMVVFDASPAALEKFAASRSPRLAADAVDEPIPEVHVAGSPAELAERCDVVISMLPASKHVLNVYEGPKGVLEGLKSGSLVVDCSTIDPDVAEHVVKKIKRSGSVGLDAPVSGGVAEVHRA